jgi:hypothetical protein
MIWTLQILPSIPRSPLRIFIWRICILGLHFELLGLKSLWPIIICFLSNAEPFDRFWQSTQPAKVPIEAIVLIPKTLMMLLKHWLNDTCKFNHKLIILLVQHFLLKLLNQKYDPTRIFFLLQLLIL